MSLKGAIFDLDGVIVDTVPLHYEAWHKMFAHFGYEFDQNIYRAKVDGRKREDGARAVMTESCEITIAEGAVMKQGFYLELLHSGRLSVFPTSVDLIRDLVSRGVKVGVASSSRNVHVILEEVGLLDAISTIVCGADLTHGKPHPEIFLTAAEHLGLEVADCIVFEDAPAGVSAAKAGGFRCIGVDRINKPEILDAADLVVSDLNECSFETLGSRRSETAC